ncbi:erythromycin esterase family protein [Pedobacter sp. Du54]|uniref:erythromycin esterase family protein n=1 Tax=Pedobacter anseongensis TaxID=3133439 RepID=UPI00309C2ED5
MKKLFVFILSIINIQSYAQRDIKEYVQENVVTIKTVVPDSLDFSDVEAIGDAIGDSRIVMLGEQDHGDAPTFLAKTRLIKYLHEKKGFNVLAFESDFFALTKGWEKLDKQAEAINPFLKQNIWGVWTYCKECENLLYKYVPNSFNTNPLQITGFDSQIHGYYSKKNLRKFVDDYLSAQKIQFTNTLAYQTDFLNYVDSVLFGNDVKKHTLFGNALATITQQLIRNDSTTFEMMLLKNLKSGNSMTISRLLKTSKMSIIRDKQMAENLQWIVNHKYPNEKVIVWAHSGHILKRPDLVKNVVIKQPMGNVFVQNSALADETYILGFTSRNGTAGRVSIPRVFTVQKPLKNSFEEWVGEKIEYGFVDFKKFNTQKSNIMSNFYMKGIGHATSSGVWNQVFDGIFYIRDMYPCNKIR